VIRTLGSYVLVPSFESFSEGEFEGWSGRASETWEQRFILTSEEIIRPDRPKIPALNITGKSVKEVCDKALEILVAPSK
jgi:hypothetical protein